MFTHDELEVIPEEIVQEFKKLELRILQDIVRRIRLTNEITRSADYQIDILNHLGSFKSDIRKYIKESLNISDKKIDELYKRVVQSGYVRDKSLYEATGNDFIKYEDNLPLQQLISAVIDTSKSELLNISETLGFVTDVAGNRVQKLSDYYVAKVNEATLQIATGAFDYNTSLKNIVNEMCNSGLRVIDYESGYHNRIEVAARRAVMTGLNKITNKISDDNMKKLNSEYAEVSFHLTARPSHQIWQGRVYSKDELVTVCGLGTVTGLMGANCYHHYDVFIPGISVRRYSDEYLEQMTKEMNSKVKFGKNEYTKYEATQKQRQLERSMRILKDKINLLKHGEADKTDIDIYKIKYRKTLDFYNVFSKDMGLRTQMERVNITGFK